MIYIKPAPDTPEFFAQPAPASDEAAGIDLRCAARRPITLQPGDRALIPTGWCYQMPKGTWGECKPRSGLAMRYGIDVMAGVIDSDYRGEVQVLLINHGGAPFTVAHGDRIAQMVIQKHEAYEFCAAMELDTTERGGNGLGSTGTD